MMMLCVYKVVVGFLVIQLFRVVTHNQRLSGTGSEDNNIAGWLHMYIFSTVQNDRGRQRPSTWRVSMSLAQYNSQAEQAVISLKNKTRGGG